MEKHTHTRTACDTLTPRHWPGARMHHASQYKYSNIIETAVCDGTCVCVAAACARVAIAERKRFTVGTSAFAIIHYIRIEQIMMMNFTK